MGQVVTDATILWAGIDLTGHANSVALDLGREMKDSTTFGARARTNKAGLLTTGVALQGLWATPPDEGLFEGLGDAEPLVIGPNGLAVGDLAYLSRVSAAEYSPLGTQVGELAPFAWSAEAGDRPVRGASLFYGLEDADFTSAGVERGAAPAGKQVFAALQVMGGTGDLDVVVESDDSDAFAAPTTRITFAQVPGATSRAAQWATPVAGPITDTWWRISATVPGSRTFAVAIGIV